MMLTDAYLGLGGNIGNSCLVLRLAIEQIAQVKGVFDLAVSRFYRTTPVSDISQNDFVNAVCKFKTSLSAKELHRHLQQIEITLGKSEKAKNAPRIIDLDVLFFGSELHQTTELTIPHPRWHERLFVLVPLADVANEILVPDQKGTTRVNIKEYLKTFKNCHNEIVSLLE